ncbi:MAG: IS200/IS605 family transposase, partial [Ignavibacteria bacterium]
MDGQIVKIWIHTFFSTKDIKPLIKNTFESVLYSKIRGKIEEEFNSYVKEIGGTEDHIHILFKLNPSFRITDILKNIKGETSHWINQNGFLEEKFTWQKSYDAYSVDESKVNLVAEFIRNQKEYHLKFTF